MTEAECNGNPPVQEVQPAKNIDPVDVNRIVGDLRNLVLSLKDEKANSSVNDIVSSSKKTLETLLARNGRSIQSLPRHEKNASVDNKNYTIDSMGRVRIVKPATDGNRNHELLQLDSENRKLRILLKDLMAALEVIMKLHRKKMVDFACSDRSAEPTISDDRIAEIQKKANVKRRQEFERTAAAVNYVVDCEAEKQETRQKLLQRLEIENFVMRAVLAREDIRSVTIDDIVDEWRHLKVPANAEDSIISVETVLQGEVGRTADIDGMSDIF